MKTKTMCVMMMVAVLNVVPGFNPKAQAGIITQSIAETVEFAAERSGKVLSVAMKINLEEALAKAAAKYGDDVLRVAREGGIELIEAGAKYGDDVWRMCAKVPGSARALAMAPDTLLPLAKRVGPEVLIMETRAPGMAARAVQNFGDDGLRALVKRGNPADMGKLVGIAERAESAQARKILLDGYMKEGGAYLDRLDWKKIMAFGASVAMLTAAYKTSDGFQDGLKTIADKQPEIFQKTLKDTLEPVALPLKLFMFALGILVLAPLAVMSLRMVTRLRGQKGSKP